MESAVRDLILSFLVPHKEFGENQREWVKAGSSVAPYIVGSILSTCAAYLKFSPNLDTEFPSAEFRAK
jgi:hypothetical protein